MSEIKIPDRPHRPNLLVQTLLKLSTAGAVGGLCGFTLMGMGVEGTILGVVILIPVWFGGKLLGYTRIYSSGSEEELN